MGSFEARLSVCVLGALVRDYGYGRIQWGDWGEGVGSSVGEGREVEV